MNFEKSSDRSNLRFRSRRSPRLERPGMQHPAPVEQIPIVRLAEVEGQPPGGDLEVSRESAGGAGSRGRALSGFIEAYADGSLSFRRA
jgi:hypothetical protein